MELRFPSLEIGKDKANDADLQTNLLRRRHMDPGDNGIYVIEGWRISDRMLPYEGFVEQSSHDFDGRREHYPVVARSEEGTPLVARYDHDGDWEWNPNNHVKSESALIVPRE